MNHLENSAVWREKFVNPLTMIRIPSKFLLAPRRSERALRDEVFVECGNLQKMRKVQKALDKAVASLLPSSSAPTGSRREAAGGSWGGAEPGAAKRRKGSSGIYHSK